MKSLIPEKHIKRLALVNQSHCYSSYIPVQNGKNILEENILNLRETLKSQNILGQRLENFIHPLEQLVEDNLIWKSTATTLAIFTNESEADHFFINKKIPSNSYVNSTFHLLPLFEEVPPPHLPEYSYELFYANDTITNRIEKIIPLAFEDKIETLYVSASNGVYGVYDNYNKTTIIDTHKKETSTSLLNLIAIQTFLNGGKVYVIPPHKTPDNGIYLQAITK